MSINDKLLYLSNLKVEDSEIFMVEAEDFLVSYASDILKYQDEDFERINIHSGFYQSTYQVNIHYVGLLHDKYNFS